MNLDALSKEQLIALVKQQTESQMRHPVEFALWANSNKTEEWHADQGGTLTFKTVDLAELASAALAEGKLEVKVFINAYTSDGSQNRPLVRGYSDLKEKVAKAA